MEPALEPNAEEPRRDVFLIALGERVRRLRAIRGMTRKSLSQATGVSERHLANLEHGVGNASILVLLQIARAFNCALAELVGDVTTESPEWLLIRELLSGRSESDLQRARESLSQLFGVGAGAQRPNRYQRIALIGLRGAGKSTLGQMLADDLGYPFIELNREIERVAGCSILEIHNLYGPNAYRRYERRALEEAVQIYPEMVLATPAAWCRSPPPSICCWRIAIPYGCAPRPKSTWAASWRRAISGPCPATPRPWPISSASWPAARRSMPRPTLPGSPAT